MSMNSESIKLLKQAAYYIKKAEFEKQSAFKGRDMSKAWEAGVKGVKSLGEGVKKGWGWLWGNKVKKEPEPRHNFIVPKNSLVDREIKAVTDYNNGTSIDEVNATRDYINRVFDTKQSPPRLFSDQLNPIYNIDPAFKVQQQLRYPAFMDGAIVGLLGQRDINKALKHKVPPKVRHQYARNFQQQHMPSEVDRYDLDRLTSSESLTSPRSLSLAQQRARWADMLQYLAQNQGDGSRRRFFETLNFEHGDHRRASSYYRPLEHRLVLQPSNSPMVLGHELGHALYYSKPNIPKQIADLVVSNDLSNMPQYKPHHSTDFNAKHGELASGVMGEVMANHEFTKLMRGALRDNPQLYDRFKTQSDRILLPALVGEAGGKDEELAEITESLPKILPRAARRYVPFLQENANNYRVDSKLWYPKLMDHMYSVGERAIENSKPIPFGMEGIAVRTLDSVARRVEKQDPTLYSDIYNHVRQNGMPVPQNAWYNNAQIPEQPQRPVDLLMKYAPPIIKRVDENGNYSYE